MSYGWEQFPLTDVIKGWIGKSGLNKGLKVQIRKIFPGQKGFTFAEATDKNREPILVINSNDYRPFKIQKPANLTAGTTSVTSEKKNRIRQGRDSLHSMCERRDMIVDVNKISWNNWILEPKVFNLYRCVGHCGVYNSKTSGEQTNHATMQAVLAETGLHSGSKVDLPCCAPRKLEPMAMLLYEKYGSTVVVKLKSLDNMIVSSCACLWVGL